MATGRIDPWLASLRMQTTSEGWFPNGKSMFEVPPGIYRTNPNALPSEGVVGNNYGVLLILGFGSSYPLAFYIGTLGQSGVYSSVGQAWHQTST